MKKTITAIMAAALMLAGCSADVPEESLAASSETEISDTDVASNGEAEEEFPKVFPAEELYDVYPVKIVYGGDTAEKISVETVAEEPILLYNDLGMEMGTFKASYPQITDERCGAEVCEKINAEIKKYRDECFESAQETVNGHGKDKSGEMSEDAKEFYETARDRFTVTFRGDSVGENFMGVYFLYSPELAGTAPEFVYPKQMVFDLRTGERVDFEKIVSDKEGFTNAMKKEMRSIAALDQLTAEDYAAAVTDGTGLPDWFGFRFVDGTEKLLTADENIYDRMAVRGGCIGFYYAMYDFGVGHGDESGFFVGIPLDEGVQYLTDEGKEIFARYKSAETKPANVIEYKGVRYFDTAERIPYGAVDKGNMTEGDREFVKLFENAWNADFYLN